jgi:tRNA(adenine34) deaminase
MALREAGILVGNHRLVDCDLFATIEPCAMCAGAMVHARVRRAVHSIMQVLNHAALNHKIDVRGGVLAGRCADILQEFFRSRR